MIWSELCRIDVEAKPQGIWTWVQDFIQGPALVKIEVDPKTATWYYSSAKSCTADGDLNAMIATRNCIVPDAPIGALIGKIGGSTSGVRDGKLFPVGSTAVITIDSNTSGPLLLTINDELTGLSDNSNKLAVKVSVLLLPAPAHPSPPPPPPAPSGQGNP